MPSRQNKKKKSKQKKKSQQKGPEKGSVGWAQNRYHEALIKKKHGQNNDEQKNDEQKNDQPPKKIVSIYQHSEDGQICSDFIKRIMKEETTSWTKIANSPVKHVTAFKSAGYRVGLFGDEGDIEESKRFNADDILYAEFHLHSNFDKQKDKVRIFSQDPPIRPADYRHFESDIQPCPPQSYTDNQRLIEKVYSDISQQFPQKYKHYRPKAKVGFYNDYDDYNYANQQSVAAVNHDFYQEFGIEASVESQLLVYGVISLLCFVSLCLLYLIIAAVSFLMGIWYERSNNNKEKNEPYIDEV